jgi:hypothetical protein
MRSPLSLLHGWITGSILCAGAVGAVTPGQVDDFQAGTAGWTSGGANPNPPTWIPDGGPLGAGDGFLRVEGNGLDGSGGNLIAFNTEQWSGDYAAAGVISIRADLRNLAESDLVIRLLVESPLGGFVSNAAASLPAGGAWRSAVIPLTATGVDVGAVLAQVTKLRILHAPTTGGAEAIIGVLGVDNLTALSGDLCLDAGLVRGDLAVCRVYCQQLDCPHGGPGRACEQLAVTSSGERAERPPASWMRTPTAWKTRSTTARMRPTPTRRTSTARGSATPATTARKTRIPGRRTASGSPASATSASVHASAISTRARSSRP